MTTSELKQAKEEQTYWRKIADILNIRLIGWTYRDVASFKKDHESIEIRGWLAERILELSNARSTAQLDLVLSEAVKSTTRIGDGGIPVLTIRQVERIITKLKSPRPDLYPKNVSEQEAGDLLD